MMRSHTKRTLDAAIDELKRDGFQVLILMLERCKDDHEVLHGMEVLCSETNNPFIVAEMAKTALQELSRNVDQGGPVN